MPSTRTRRRLAAAALIVTLTVIGVGPTVGASNSWTAAPAPVLDDDSQFYAEELRFQRLRFARVVVHTPTREVVDQFVSRVDPVTETIDDLDRFDTAYAEAGPAPGVDLDAVTPATVNRADGSDPSDAFLIDEGTHWVVVRPDGTISDRVEKGSPLVAEVLAVEVTTTEGQ